MSGLSDSAVADAPAAGGETVERRLPVAEYWAPITVFGLFTAVESYVPAAHYPLAYSIKIAAVAAALWWARRTLSPIRPSWRVVAPAVLVGIAVFAQWIILDKVVPYPHFGSRASFNPFDALHSSAAVVSFLAIRALGLVAIVPVMEEVFWRGFLLRFLTSDRFELLPLGSFSTQAFWIVTAAFAAAHPEWLVALVAGAAYAWLLRSTRSLFAAVLAHAVTNAALGAYVVAVGDWKYW